MFAVLVKKKIVSKHKNRASAEAEALELARTEGTAKVRLWEFTEFEIALGKAAFAPVPVKPGKVQEE